MKNRNNLVLIAASLLAYSLFLSSCETPEEIKAKENQEIPESSVQQSEDGTTQNETVDEVVDIATGSFGNSGMRKDEEEDNCNVEKKVEGKTATLTFNGDNCAGTRKREGVIVAKVTSAVEWFQEGGTIEITFNNFKVTRKSDNKSIIINGKHVVYNVSGVANPLVHTMHGALSVNFDNSTSREWLVSRKRTISFEGGIIRMKVESDSSNFITETGVNREGKKFITTIPAPLVVQNCESGAAGYKAIAGEIVYTVDEAALSVGFGYKSLTERPEDCSATGSVLTYTDKTTLAKKYFPYK